MSRFSDTRETGPNGEITVIAPVASVPDTPQIGPKGEITLMAVSPAADGPCSGSMA